MISASGDFGASPFKKIGKFAKRAAKGAVKGTKFVAKTAVNVAGLPVKLLLLAASQASRVVCALPPLALKAAVAAAGLGPAGIAVVPAFCKAVRAGQLTSIRKLLPQILKIAAAASIGRLRARTSANISGGYLGDDSLDGADVELLDYLAGHSHEVLESALNGASDDDIAGALGVPVSNTAGMVGLGLGLLVSGTGLWLVFRR